MSILSDFFNEAGWPIFPTLAFGVAALSIAIKMIDKPTEQLASLVRNLSVLTLLMGMLGTVLGPCGTSSRSSPGCAGSLWWDCERRSTTSMRRC